MQSVVLFGQLVPAGNVYSVPECVKGCPEKYHHRRDINPGYKDYYTCKRAIDYVVSGKAVYIEGKPV